jgi:hypothetical protein
MLWPYQPGELFQIVSNAQKLLAWLCMNQHTVCQAFLIPRSVRRRGLAKA